MSIDDILQMDDVVDELAFNEVKDAWVRGTFMHQIIKANGSEYMRSDSCSAVEDMLKNKSNAGLMEAAIEGLGRRHPVTQSLGWEDGPGNIETLYTRFTNNSYTESELRDAVKTALRGSGMPRITVMRARVRNHSTR